MVAVGRLLHCLLGMVLLLAAGFASAGTAYVFDGRAINNCTYSSSNKEYICSALPLTDYQDSVEIASNIKVFSTQAIVFGYSQGLKMSGSARLVSYGDIDIGGIQSSLLQVSGGSFLTDRVFRMGAVQQTITANIKADDIYLGSGSTGSVTGTIEASRTVSIASYMTVTGNISGTVVTTGSPAKITGSVTASTSFSLASGSTMTGNINSPSVSLLAAGTRLTGNITSSGPVTVGSGNNITGSVTADTLTTEDSEVYISGNATVRYATLGYHGRVEGNIYCTGGNTAGSCDCVSNNSDYAINSTNGPSCPYMPRAGAHHYQISHPVKGVTCMPSTVTITACANSACSAPHYTGGASVTLSPGNKTFPINTGVNSAATVEQGNVGIATIATVPATTGLVCIGSGGASPTNDCKINFANSTLDFEDLRAHVSATVEAFTLKAIKAVNSSTCAPAFSGTKSVSFGCTYENPGPVADTVRVGVDNLPVTVNGTALSCNGSTQSIQMTFDSAGQAPVTMQYADVGQIGLSASIANPSMSGAESVIVAPASFAVQSQPLSVITTGDAFTRTITAKNSVGNTTVNFGRESSPETVTMSRVLCAPSGGINGAFTASITGYVPPLAPAPPGPRTGTVSAQMSYAEVGIIDVIATLASGSYLSSGLTVTGNTGTGGSVCKDGNGNVGRFKPDHFDVTVAKPPAFIYSGQPFVTSVTAKNHANVTTGNYSGTVHAKLVTLTVHDSTGTVANPGPGTFRPALSPATAAAVTIAASRFAAGAATPATLPVYAFTDPLRAPLSVLIRATDTDGVSSTVRDEAKAIIRRGRLRLFGAFGRSNADLTLPFRTEYWTGQSWLLNTDDTTTAAAFPVSAVAMPAAPVPATAPRVISVSPLAAGQGTIVMRPGAANGPVDYAVNLGLATAGAATQNRSCLTAIPVANVGAEMPWLRWLNGNCRTTYDNDPAARATFGVIIPEQRRVIHVREVFR